MKIILIILLFLILFGGLVTFLSIRKKSIKNSKKARFETQKMKEEAQKEYEKLRQDMSDNNE